MTSHSTRTDNSCFYIWPIHELIVMKGDGDCIQSSGEDHIPYLEYARLFEMQGLGLLKNLSSKKVFDMSGAKVT